jgi:hypothetical protein
MLTDTRKYLHLKILRYTELYIIVTLCVACINSLHIYVLILFIHKVHAFYLIRIEIHRNM